MKLTVSVNGRLKRDDWLPCCDSITNFFRYLEELALGMLVKVV